MPVPTLEVIYPTGSVPIEDVPEDNPEGRAHAEERARGFMYENIGADACVLGGGEGRFGTRGKRPKYDEPGEQSWVVGLVVVISRALHIPLIGFRTYGQNALHILLGALIPYYVPFVALGIWKLPQLPYAKWALEDRQDFDDKYKDRRRNGARFMRGISSAWALKIFSGAIWLPLRMFERRIIANLREILTKYPDTVIQFELPLELAAGIRIPMPRWLRKLIYRGFLRSVARIIRATPAGTSFAFHLCWGDLGGKPVVPASRQKVMAKIDLINAIMTMPVWDDWDLYAIHEPYGSGEDKPAITKRELKKIARHLHVLPEHLRGVIWALGVLHIDSESDETLELVQKLIRVLAAKGIHVFAIATPCGMGRMDEEKAKTLIRRGREVIRGFYELAA